MPRYAAKRVLLAPLEDVWAFLAEPYHLSDWWPGLGGIEPDRRGLAPGARWKIRGSDVVPAQTLLPWAGLFRRPGASGTLLVTDVVPMRQVTFQLVNERVEAEVDLEALDSGHTRVDLVVTAPWGTMRRSFPQRALARLYDLVQTAAEP